MGREYYAIRKIVTCGQGEEWDEDTIVSICQSKEINKSEFDTLKGYYLTDKTCVILQNDENVFVAQHKYAKITLEMITLKEIEEESCKTTDSCIMRCGKYSLNYKTYLCDHKYTTYDIELREQFESGYSMTIADFKYNPNEDPDVVSLGGRLTEDIQTPEDAVNINKLINRAFEIYSEPEQDIKPNFLSDGRN